MVKLPVGKIPPRVLEDIVFRFLGKKREEVVVGPSRGLDGAIIEIGDRLLVTSMDPITGAAERLGLLAVNINANDVATFGVQPAFFTSCMLLTENATQETLRTICAQIDFAAKELGLAVTGGHSEITPGLPFSVVVGCCMGVTEKQNYVTSQGAEAGNELILTKSVGIEGTAILAADRRDQLEDKVEKSTLKKAEALFSKISVVKEALLAFETGHVTAMHDPTEGGVAGGLHEFADASHVGFKIYEENFSIARETMEICRFFQIDPLQLIASGSLLIAVEKTFAGEIVEILKRNMVAAAVIGEFVSSEKKRIIIRKDGSSVELSRPVSDDLWLALKKANGIF